MAYRAAGRGSDVRRDKKFPIWPSIGRQKMHGCLDCGWCLWVNEPTAQPFTFETEGQQHLSQDINLEESDIWQFVWKEPYQWRREITSVAFVFTENWEGLSLCLRAFLLLSLCVALHRTSLLWPETDEKKNNGQERGAQNWQSENKEHDRDRSFGPRPCDIWRWLRKTRSGQLQTYPTT